MSLLPIYEILFETWKNKCDKCLSQPTIENIQELCQFLQSPQCSAEFLQPLNSYCLFPFRILIERLPTIAKSQPKFSVEKFLQQIFQTLSVIFQKIRFTDRELFEEFLTILSFFIDEDVDSKQKDSLFNYPPKIIKINADLYPCLFDCLENLLKSHDQYKLWFRNFDGELKFKFGYLINSCIKLIQCHNSLVVKGKALDTISNIIVALIPGQFRKNSKLNPEEFFEEINFVAFALPRMVSTISKVFVLYHDLGNNSLSRKGLKLFGLILTTVFHWKQTFPKEEIGSKNEDNSKNNMKLQFNQIWFDETCVRLTPIFKNIVRYFLKSSEETGNEHEILLRFCYDLFECCSQKFILKFIKILIQIPLTLNDNDEKKKNLFNLMNFGSNDQVDEDSTTTLFNLIQESFFEHIKALPYLVRNIDYSSLISNDRISTKKILTDSDTSLALNVLANFVILFGNHQHSSLYEFIKLEQHSYHLFRTMVNLVEFDFKQILPLSLAEIEHFDSKFNTTTLHDATICPNIGINDLLDSLKLENHLRYLQDRSLFRQYSNVVRLLARFPANGTDVVIIEHMTQLLEHSQFEPSVVLVMNLLLEGFSQQQSTSCLQTVYRSSLIDLYLKHLNNLAQLFAIEEIVESKHSNKQIEPIRLSSLMTICSRSNETVIDHRTSDSQKNSIITTTSTSGSNNNSSLCLHRHILKHCLILHGLTILNTGSDNSNEFYQKCFCHFLQSFSSEYRFISNTAKNLLIFIGQQQQQQQLDRDQHNNGSNLFYIYQMIVDNFTYLYSSFSIALDYSVLHRNPNPNLNSNESILYQYSYDHYSLKTVQLSLIAIFRLFRYFNSSSKNLKTSQLQYFNLLIDQILKIIKYYSIRRPENCSENLNRLLLVLHSYLELLTVIYGDDTFQLDRKCISYNLTDSSVDDLIDNIEQFAQNLQFINEQMENNDIKDNVDDDDDPIGTKPQDNLEDMDPDLEKNIQILSSPIINSRASQILYTCSLILSDTNIDIRLNVLKLISMSMRLLRTYEDVLLPYVHKLWDPLVDRFSTDYDHPVILQCAFRCLLLASEFCGDFLLARSRKDILPRLISFLDVQLELRRNQSYNSKLSSVKSIEYYAESELLRSIGQLVVNLKLESLDLWKVIPTLLLYLCVYRVEPELQRYAFESLIQISTRLDSSSIYYYLHRIIKLYYPDSTTIIDNLPNLEDSKFCCNCGDISNQTNLQESRKKLSKYFQKFEETLLNDLLGHLASV